MKGNKSVDHNNLLTFHPDKQETIPVSLNLSEDTAWRAAMHGLVTGTDVSGVIQALIEQHLPPYKISVQQKR